MKKLMMFAAAMTIVVGAFAQGSCDEGSGTIITGTCGVPVWDFMMSGKTANEAPQGGYKSVQSFRYTGIVIGEVVSDTIAVEDPLNPGVTNLVETGICCIESFAVGIYDRKFKEVYVFPSQMIEKMSVFGKNLDKVLKPGASTTLESDVMWTLEDGDIALQFVGFGKGKRSVTKDKPNSDPCGDNSVEGCDEKLDWPSWSGWFTGWYGMDYGDSIGLDCLCVEAVAGGTWSMKFNKKLSIAAGGNVAEDFEDDVEKIVGQKFKGADIFWGFDI